LSHTNELLDSSRRVSFPARWGLGKSLTKAVRSSWLLIQTLARTEAACRIGCQSTVHLVLLGELVDSSNEGGVKKVFECLRHLNTTLPIQLDALELQLNW